MKPSKESLKEMNKTAMEVGKKARATLDKLPHPKPCVEKIKLQNIKQLVIDNVPEGYVGIDEPNGRGVILLNKSAPDKDMIWIYNDCLASGDILCYAKTDCAKLEYVQAHYGSIFESADNGQV